SLDDFDDFDDVALDAQDDSVSKLSISRQLSFISSPYSIIRPERFTLLVSQRQRGEMAFRPFEVNTPHIIYACLGGFVVLFGMFSLFLREKLYIGEACWAFIFGIIIGPYGANIFNPRGWGDASDETTDAITLEFTRVVLAIGVFAIGVELPKAYMKRHWKSLFFLLAPVMTWGWFVSAGFIYALIPGLNFLSALCVAACLTPTDPILAAAVVGGKYADKHVPAHLRHLLAAESGCNDGAAFPFLFIALYLTIDNSTGDAIRDWFLLLWLSHMHQIVLGVVIGALLGIAFRYLMKFCQRYDLIDRHSYVAQYVSLAILTIGVTILLGSDDLLSTFACGTAFAWDGFFNRQTEESVFSSVIDLLFNITAFVYVGAWMPFGEFTMKEELTLEVWRLIVIAILVLLFRRLPVMIALYKWIPDVKTFREAVFSGHFGPIGIGAVFISTLAAEFLSEHINEVDAEHPDGSGVSDQTRLLANTIQPISAFMVLCSITIHGLSIPGFSLSRRIHSRTFSRRTTFGNGTTIDSAADGARQPEWATQVGHIRRGEDIVINRDPEHMEKMRQRQSDIETEMTEKGGDEVDRMERGESSLDRRGSEDADVDGSPGESTILEKPEQESEQKVVYMEGDGRGGTIIATDHAKRERKPSASPESHRRRSVASASSHRGGEPRVESDGLAPSHAEQLPEGEEPPDGEEGEVVDEWQEGPHRIIERRKGPGEEVEVEVVRNWFYDGHGHGRLPHGFRSGHGQRKKKDSNAGISSVDSGEHERKVFRGSSQESVRREVGEYLARLGSVPEAVEKKVEQGAEEVKEGVQKVGSEVEKMGEEAKEGVERVVAGRVGEDVGKRNTNDTREGAEGDDDEEGWASDHSSPSVAPSRSKSKSPKMKSITVASGLGAGSGSRKRRSMRRGWVGRVMHRGRGGAEGDKEVSEERQRGVVDLDDAGANDEEERGRGRSALPIVIEASSSSSSMKQRREGHTQTRSRPQLSPSRPSLVSSPGSGSFGEHRRSSSGQLGQGQRLRHHRLDSLRVIPPSGLSSREQSPARSIRFFDETPSSAGVGSPTSPGFRSGVNTPRREDSVPGTPMDDD
ncbi:hypothetical protein D9758_018587, partial [Tetrapyrgos nigripes]